jgi:rubredoxin
MKNPFKSFRFKRPKKRVEVPWKKKGESEHDLRKTRIGQNPDNLNCPQCEYPLITLPSIASPCPNCGFVGNQSVPAEKSSGKTMNLSQINLTPSSPDPVQNDPPATRFRFKLIMEPTDEILIEGEENEVILNRESLDPGNSTISGERHILIRLINQQFFIRDLSTNGSTFLQAKYKTPLNNNCRLVLGNILLKFSGGDDQVQQADDGKTKMFGQFNMAPSFSTGTLNLINEGTGKTYSFQQQKIVLNRSNIDPSNMSISGDKHALFEFSGGKWFVTDQSSNGATFVQVLNETSLKQKQKLLLGNRIFRFEY